MNIWHDTADAPRSPRRVSPTQNVELTIGTWPIEPGQAVWVRWAVTTADGSRTDGTTAARWERNTEVNSYWVARLGPFADGDRVTYTIHGSSPEGPEQTADASFRVRPALYIAWLWHQHQPLYRDLSAHEARGSYRYPWVRLHALRDYYSMAALAAEGEMRLTINLTPVLLQQIDDYVHGGATDVALELTRRPAESLSKTETDDLLSTFFDADWHHQVYVHPRYRELFERRTSGQRFTRQDIRDLQMWFNLAWFGSEFRGGEVLLVTGETVSVSRFVRQQRGFCHDDVLAMVEEQYKILRAIVPLHRELQTAGRIEVTTTPAFHPILPLLVDTDSAHVDRHGASIPSLPSLAADARGHVTEAITDYRRRFGEEPRGMWPAEGAVSAPAARMLAQHGLAWIATDRGVLARSGKWGYDAWRADVLCQPYQHDEHGTRIAVFFRDTELSDGIGFRYGAIEDPEAAVTDFVHAIETRILDHLQDEDDRLLTIVLDGENAWGGYKDDGRPFLRALYRRLTADARFRAVTFSDYLTGRLEAGVPAHPVEALARVHDLATGSWIDEPGSAPGVDLGTWIGEPEENAAWTLLAHAHAAVAAADGTAPNGTRARQALYAAEGSDWFWWFGTDQESRNDAAFDELFRGHLRAAYQALGIAPPDDVDDPIVTHPVIWSFTRPVQKIRAHDRLTIRTNCPGRLTYRLDAGDERSTSMVAVGGVMAGARRFQVTLGPFAAPAKRLDFAFHCEHEGCSHDAPCCAGTPQQIQLTARRVAVTQSRTRSDSRDTV